MQKLMIMPLQMYNGTKRELLITTSLLVKVPFCATVFVDMCMQKSKDR